MFKEPIPYKGQLNLFNVPMSVAADALKAIELPEIERHTPTVKVAQRLMFDAVERQ